LLTALLLFLKDKEEASVSLIGQMMTGMENKNSSDPANNIDYA
jgi:hypothetical protein